jgi:hypothetical protein
MTNLTFREHRDSLLKDLADSLTREESLRQQVRELTELLDCVKSERAEQLAECQAQNTKLSERVVGVGEIAINSVSRDRLAECQARENSLRDALEFVVDRIEHEYREDAPVMVISQAAIAKSESGSSNELSGLLKAAYYDGYSEKEGELRQMLKSAKRDALLEAAEYCDNQWRWSEAEYQQYEQDVGDGIRRMAEELE